MYPLLLNKQSWETFCFDQKPEFKKLQRLQQRQSEKRNKIIKWRCDNMSRIYVSCVYKFSSPFRWDITQEQIDLPQEDHQWEGPFSVPFLFRTKENQKRVRIDFKEKRNEKVARCLGQKLSWWKYKFSEPCWLHPLIIGASYSYTCKIQGLVMQMCLLAHFTNARFVTLILPSYSYFWRWRSLNSISV